MSDNNGWGPQNAQWLQDYYQQKQDYYQQKLESTDTYTITTTDNASGTTWVYPTTGTQITVEGQPLKSDPYVPAEKPWYAEPDWLDKNNQEDLLEKLQQIMKQKQAEQDLELAAADNPPVKSKPEIAPVEPRRPRMIRLKQAAA